jgi:tRNA pseudouridine55 synthase
MDGFLVIDKPEGITSHGVVERVRRLFSQKKVGHCGTLDPMATGVLVLGLGKGTRLSRFIQVDPKKYLAQITLGIKTDTLDKTGKILEEKKIRVEEREVREVLLSFQGEITQVPPMTSAVKVGGVPLYKLARKGVEVERKPRQVYIHKIDFLSFEEDEYPRVNFKITCSKGTYIRVIASEVGKKLGCGAHLSALRRLRCGDYDLKIAHKLDEVEEKESNNELKKLIITFDEALKRYPIVVVKRKLSYRVRNGNPVTLGMVKHRSYPLANETYVRIFDEEGNFLAFGKWVGENAQNYRQVVAPLEVVL